jgi:hypothetical protein
MFAGAIVLDVTACKAGAGVTVTVASPQVGPAGIVTILAVVIDGTVIFAFKLVLNADESAFTWAPI